MKDLLRWINEVRVSNDYVPVEGVDESMDLREDLNYDSFMLAELTVLIEDEVGVDIFAEGVVRTVGEIQNRLHE